MNESFKYGAKKGAIAGVSGGTHVAEYAAGIPLIISGYHLLEEAIGYPNSETLQTSATFAASLLVIGGADYARTAFKETMAVLDTPEKDNFAFSSGGYLGGAVTGFVGSVGLAFTIAVSASEGIAALPQLERATDWEIEVAQDNTIREQSPPEQIFTHLENE